MLYRSNLDVVESRTEITLFNSSSKTQKNLKLSNNLCARNFILKY